MKASARRHAINIETMKVFCHVAREQSFSRGAMASGITQSAATQCVRRIEEHLRTQLIDRCKRPLISTRAGQLCYREFCRIVEIHDALVDQLQAEHREIGGTIDVAAIYSVELHGLGACMQQFLRSYPQAKVQLEYRRPDEVYDAVETGRAHLGLVSYPQARPGLTVADN
ncbi:MAG: LysR family transcriptional regulator [Thermoguttaceae bacterium]|nr:LysR family transcriptional regulator [Thermoguttaceae bacterium]